MKKNILIFSHALNIGGAERALIGFLNSIDYNKYNIDLFLMRHEGELLKFVPKEVNILPEIKQYTALTIPITQAIKQKNIGVAVGRTFGKLNTNIFNKTHKLKESYVSIDYSHKYTNMFMPKISHKNYDLAISFITPHYFVMNKVNAKKKIAWIHTDYSYIDIDIKSELKIWSKYDNIISISQDVTKGFINKFSSLKEKIIEVQNIVSKKSIIDEADTLDVSKEILNDSSVKLLSIGRFCTAKNFDNVPVIAKIIKSLSINIKWYIIGFGSDEELIIQRIKENQAEDYVIILGKKDNPYPYIKACDIYVQPSRYEGKAVTVDEARILAKPIIITNYPSSASQLKDGYEGIIVPMDNEDCAKGIIDLINDKQKQEELIKYLSEHNYSNEDEVNKIYDLIGD